MTVSADSSLRSPMWCRTATRQRSVLCKAFAGISGAEQSAGEGKAGFFHEAEGCRTGSAGSFSLVSDLTWRASYLSTPLSGMLCGRAAGDPAFLRGGSGSVFNPRYSRIPETFVVPFDRDTGIWADVTGMEQLTRIAVSGDIDETGAYRNFTVSVNDQALTLSNFHITARSFISSGRTPTISFMLSASRIMITRSRKYSHLEMGTG